MGNIFCVFRSISLDNGLDGPLSDSLFLYSSICFEASKDTKIKMSQNHFFCLFVVLVYNISISRKKVCFFFLPFTLLSVNLDQVLICKRNVLFIDFSNVQPVLSNKLARGDIAVKPTSGTAHQVDGTEGLKNQSAKIRGSEKQCPISLLVPTFIPITEHPAYQNDHFRGQILPCGMLCHC